MYNFFVMLGTAILLLLASAAWSRWWVYALIVSLASLALMFGEYIFVWPVVGFGFGFGVARLTAEILK